MVVRARIGIVIALGGMLGCSAISGLSGLDFDGGGGASTESTSSGRGASSGSAGGPGSGAGGATPTCTDGTKNGSETDVDCGGSCPPCPLGAACKTEGDCATPGCVDGYCQTAPLGVWEESSAVNGAAARSGCSMIWDGSSIQMLDGRRQTGMVEGGTTYLWNGVIWSSMTTQPLEFQRRYDAMYTTTAGGMLIFGGVTMGDEPLNDTWALADGAMTWVQFEPSGLIPQVRAAGAIAPLDGGGALLFGGTPDFTTAVGDTWQFDGTNWQKLNPAHPPPARFGATMAYDAKHQRALLFGGIPTMSSIPLGDYWLWTGSDWQQGTANPPPPPRSGAAMVYASQRERVVLFTGAQPGVNLTDTWEWDGSSWIETSTAAPPVQGACAAYDPVRRRVVLYGGQHADASFVADTWEYHVHGEACQKAADCDTNQCVDGLCCEQASCGKCKHCNDPTNPGVCTACDCDANDKCL